MTITNTYKRIPLDQIIVDRATRQRDPGKELDTSDLEPSIKARGVIQPIVVEVQDDKYKIIMGERRWTASSRIGLKDIPARICKDLTPIERRILEFEENVRREDLPWKDQVRAIKEIHDLYSQIDSTWTQAKTASELFMTDGNLSINLRVAEELAAGNPLVMQALGMRAAYNIISRRDGRAVDDAMNEFLSEPERSAPTPQAKMVNSTPLAPAASPPPIIHKDSILNEDFCSWAPAYSGIPFNFLHCDFPYGIGLDTSEQANTKSYGGYEDSEETYWTLCQCLVDNLDRLVAQSAHIMFWLSGDIGRQYETLQFFKAKAPSIVWIERNLIWHKTDNRGILPDPKRGPRYVTEHALIGARGDRHIVKSVSNAYGSPTTKEVHQSEKPEPMLRHFFSMFVDSNTRMLDPTCGSATSLRAAESHGATHVVGLEIDPNFYEGARTALRKFRTLRSLEKK